MRRAFPLAVATAAALVAPVTMAACRDAGPVSVQAQDEGAGSPKKKDSAAALKSLTLTPAKSAKPVVGAEINVAADGLPPNRMVDLLWETVDGGWVVEDGYRFRGKRFAESTKVLGRSQVGADGRLTASFTIPEDFGGVHSVTVSDGGKPLAQGGVEVTQTFGMHPS